VHGGLLLQLLLMLQPLLQLLRPLLLLQQQLLVGLLLQLAAAVNARGGWSDLRCPSLRAWWGSCCLGL
jgi:hypothetical protein